MKKLIHLLTILFLTVNLFAQEKLGYQQPPEAIMELVNAPLAPSVLIDSKGERRGEIELYDIHFTKP